MPVGDEYKDGFNFKVTPDRIRLLSNQGALTKRDWSTEEAKMFLQLFGGDIEAELMKTLTGFVQNKVR